MIFTASPSFATISYLVTVDTNSFSGTAGFLEFQFNPGGLTSLSATAEVSDFTPSANLGAVVPPVIGSVTGTLPPAITLANDQFSDYFTNFTYASSLSFLLTFSGTALDSPNSNLPGTTFFFTMYDDGPSPILTSNPDGFAFTVDINPNGTTTVTNFITSTSSIDQVVPEPASLALGIAGLIALTAISKFRRVR